MIMQQWFLMSFIAVLLLALIVLVVRLWLNWRRKMRRHALLEQLIDDVKDRQWLRSEKIVDCLTSQAKLDEQSALDLSAALVAAEKLFIVQFIEQQKQESVDVYYDNLYELLDNHS